MSSLGGKTTSTKYSEEKKQWGSKGGSKTIKKYGKDHFRELQKKSVEARKRKKQAQNGMLTS